MLNSIGDSQELDQTAVIDTIAKAVLAAHPEIRGLDWSVCPPTGPPSPRSVPASLLAPIKEFPDPPLDRTPLFERIEQGFRGHRPSPRLFTDPMPRADRESFASDDAGIVAAFDAGFVETISLLKGAMKDGSLDSRPRKGHRPLTQNLVPDGPDRTLMRASSP